MGINSEHSYGVNHSWGRKLVDQLVRAGIRNFVISPGGRSMGLVIAAREHSAIRLTVHPDERGAAYFAVGLAKAESCPAVVVSTSGTAVANYLPAVLEAWYSQTPLIVLTADMPGDLSACGENQSIEQPDIFGENICWKKDIEVTEALLTGQTTSEIAKSLAEFSSFGPVHLNCRFSKPLLQQPADIPSPEQHSSPGQYRQSRPQIDNAGVKSLRDKIRQAKKGIISVGRLPAGLQTKALEQFTENTGWPVLADCISGLRWSGKNLASVLPAPDLLLQNPVFLEQMRPDLIVHFGGQPLQNSHNRFLAESSAELAVVDPFEARINPWKRLCSQVQAKPEEVLHGLTEASSLLTRIAVEVRDRVQSIKNCDTLFSEIEICREIFSIAEDGEAFFVGNSLPIRAVDLVDIQKSARLGHNRGVSGIDGLAASAAGFLGAAGKGTGTFIVGDMSLFHDLNSLALVKKSARQIIVVLFNNQGGQIFSRLPVLSEVPGFQECFVAPPEVDFKNAARAFDLDYRLATDIQEFREQYSAARKQGESSVLEVLIEPDAFNCSLTSLGAQIDDALVGIEKRV